MSVSSPGILVDGLAHDLLPWDGFYVSPDGKRVLTVRYVEDDAVKPAPLIHVVENWLAAFGD